MREAIGGTWIFSIVIVFIILFSSFLAISVNYSSAFRVKNDIVGIIERNEGHNSYVEDAIEEYYGSVGYGAAAGCKPPATGMLPVLSTTGQKYRYCIQCTQKNISGASSGMDQCHYKVTVFFKLDLPIIGNIFVFPVSGETKPIYRACDCCKVD